ncbi:sodium:proton antiporter [Fodinisporobacter ferrooxydans]|uniref:Sodium:proton antiporter n=1 Tax=Fodinisporobacter ferrooxydans TaxID=2901836 RepID=A0ABY4CSE1_9BACL|nr:sodium:proton antiporter [Alicyclobacillaceae bacterium MYW30-H2]
MESSALEVVNHTLFLFFIVFLCGTIGGKIAEQLKLPDVVIYLLIGIVVGPEAVSWVDVPTSSILNQFILTFGSAFILFHGGTVTHFHVLKKVWRTIALLATIGVLITALVVAGSTTWLFSIPFTSALLLGAMIASTDPAALVPIFKKFPVKPQVAQTVISESAFNDATGSILTIVLLGILTASKGGGASFGFGSTLLQFLQLAGGGIAVGVVFGFAGAILISEQKRGLLTDFAPMVSVLLVLGAYLGAEWIHASGFMSVFSAGLMIGNPATLKLTILPSVNRGMHYFIDIISLKLRMMIFILLGAQIDFSLLGQYFWKALLVVIVFICIGRPLAVLSSLLPDRKAGWKWNEIVFMFWTRETGVIPAALVGMVSGMGLPDAGIYTSVALVAILSTLLVQAGTTPFVAKQLGLLSKVQKDPQVAE